MSNIISYVFIILLTVFIWILITVLMFYFLSRVLAVGTLLIDHYFKRRDETLDKMIRAGLNSNKEMN